MIEPQGPLPPEIYWRRRIVAAGAALAVVALVVGLIIWTSVGGDDSPQNAAATSSVSSTTTTTTPSAASDSSEAPSGGGTGGSGGSGGSGGGASGSTDPSGSATAVPSAGGAGGAAAALCPDQNLAVVLYTDKPTYTTGSQPVFTLVTTNAGLTACTRDVGKASQNVVVRTLDGTRTLWTARDCSPINTVNNQVLQPQQQVKDTITWSGTTSNPGCDKPRVQVPVGSYQAIGKIGEKESAPITFNVVAPAQP
ncbi:hypothetical protein GCM10009624_00250 [Gordonia sinesedis]